MLRKLINKNWQYSPSGNKSLYSMAINPHKKLHLMILFTYLLYVHNSLNIKNVIIFNTQI